MRRFKLADSSAILLAALLIHVARADETGKDIAFGRTKGDCLACHSMPTLADAFLPGNSGPPLIAMQARFPEKAILRAKIWDATKNVPESIMPPMGKHQVLTEDEIDKVVEFIYGL